jgi:hypothetical protein
MLNQVENVKESLRHMRKIYLRLMLQKIKKRLIIIIITRGMRNVINKNIFFTEKNKIIFIILIKIMKTQEILTIIAMAALALCLVLAFSKGLTNNTNTKSAMTHVCSLLVVIAVALLAVTQFLSEKENMDWEIGSVATVSRPNGRGSGGKKMGLGKIGNMKDNNDCGCWGGGGDGPTCVHSSDQMPCLGGCQSLNPPC